jgi:pimeloyl-ACP methyl ester carboxylesterase
MWKSQGLSLAATGLMIYVSGCTAFGSSHWQGALDIDKIAQTSGLAPVTGHTLEVILHRKSPGARRHYVFFEGDGAAWGRQGATPPNNPTPKHSLAMEMATETPAKYSVTYVGRECQFIQINDTTQDECPQTRWTTARYNAAYIARITSTLKRLISQPTAAETYFVGHSGGGTVALLAAASLQPDCTVTMAAPIDINAWSNYHGWDALSESLNPADTLDSIPQNKRTHHYGGRDPLVPITSSGFSVSDKSFRVWHRVEHSRGWIGVWKQIKSDPCGGGPPTDG